jgi:signal transduction histidine kinase
MDFKALQPYEGIIYLLTIILSLTFGAVILTLRHNAIILREKKWATPFTVTFFMLAGIYFLLLLDLRITPPAPDPRPNLSYLIEAVINLSSGVTNYLLLLSAYWLAEPVINKRWLLSFKSSKLGRVFTWPTLLFVLCAAGLLMSAKPLLGWGNWVKAPDAIFSAIALFLMGYVLYHSISYRHDERMAKAAFLASFCYAILYLFYGLTITQHLVSLYFSVEKEAEVIAGLVTSLISLVLKFGIFFPAYSLMLLVSGPLEGVDRLLKPITRKNKEYLESDGVVRSILNELRVSSVRLYIKRPGPDDERVVLCAYPPLRPTLNGNHQEPQEVKYEKGSHYDRVLKTGEPYIDSPPHRLIRKISKVAVPVRFHKSVIAVLYVERGEKNFTEADLINLKRIATMVSPAVQAYREMDALKKVGQELSQLQIKVKEYDMQRDVGDITKRVHDAISPLATGVSIEIGFAEYQGTYPPDGELEELVKRRLAAALGEEDETDQEGNRWFTMDLKIPIGNAKGEKDGEQVFGKLIFLPESEQIKSVRVTVGTNPTFRRVLSDLLTETLLNFIRGRLNRLTDKLGSRLSGLKVTDTESWRKVVEDMAQEARLLWVVVGDPEREKENQLVGDEEPVKIVERLESSERREQAELKAENLWLYSLEEPRSETYHVIKKYLKESEATLWFGVARQGFGHELDYVSPWRYFLDHFCEIADSALRRIQMMKREEKLNKNILVLYTMIGAKVDKGVFVHRLLNHALDLFRPLESLLAAVRNGGLHLNNDLQGVIARLRSARRKLEEEITLLTDAAQRNSRRPCSLSEAIEDVDKEVGDDLVDRGIRLEIQAPPEATIDVPFGIAKSALSALLVNARDALVDDPEPDKVIRIKVEQATAEKFVCDIIDNGPGIPEGMRPTLFDGVSLGSKDNSHGVGLLLSRTSLIICGGDITLLERNGERGAGFRIEFPRVASSPNHTRQ